MDGSLWMRHYCRFGVPVLSDYRTFPNPAKMRIDALILRGLRAARSACLIQPFNFPLLAKRVYGDVSPASFTEQECNH